MNFSREDRLGLRSTEMSSKKKRSQRFVATNRGGNGKKEVENGEIWQVRDVKKVIHGSTVASFIYLNRETGEVGFSGGKGI